MNLQFKFLSVSGALAAALATASVAQGSGYEKSIPMGGKTAGYAGIATPQIEGAEALIFNPAGLAAEHAGHELHLNLSPSSTQFKGPINNQNDVETSGSKILPIYGLTYGYSSSSKWGIGLGTWVGGGSNVEFSSVDFKAPSGYQPEVKNNLLFTEYSLGAAYKVSDDLKIGIAWRYVNAKADFSIVKRTGGAASTIVNAKYTGLQDSEAMAFRIGAQYRLSPDTKFGAAFRSRVNFDAGGNVSGRVFSPVSSAAAANFDLAESSATAHTTLPLAASFGVDHRLNDDWSILSEYTFTQYSGVADISTETSSPILGNPVLVTQWQDQHNVRLGAEYRGFFGDKHFPLRFGYVYTSKVTNSDYARATFVPPGPAHSVSVGTSEEFGGVADASDLLRLDMALDYTTATGDASNGADAGQIGVGTDTRSGTYTVTATTLHVGLSYIF